MTLTELMVATCDRLLTLLTGEFPLQGTKEAAALEAIGLLASLESALRCQSTGPLPLDLEAALQHLKHRELVLGYVREVIDALTRRGLLPTAA